MMYTGVGIVVSLRLGIQSQLRNYAVQIVCVYTSSDSFDPVRPYQLEPALCTHFKRVEQLRYSTLMLRKKLLTFCSYLNVNGNFLR